MGIQYHGAALTVFFGVASLIAGCNSAQTLSTSVVAEKSDVSAASPDMQHMAEAALGKQAEIIAHGDLARNGMEQLLVVNRAAKSNEMEAKEGSHSRVLITRAAVLESNNGRWSEVLRCDEHLKNPRGYLGGTPVSRVSGWRLEYTSDTPQGLELKFTPAEAQRTNEENSDSGEQAKRTVVVRWNSRANRYQSFDSSQKQYLSESPTLEIPESFLR